MQNIQIDGLICTQCTELISLCIVYYMWYCVYVAVHKTRLAIKTSNSLSFICFHENKKPIFSLLKADIDKEKIKNRMYLLVFFEAVIGWKPKWTTLPPVCAKVEKVLEYFRRGDVNLVPFTNINYEITDSENINALHMLAN